MRRTFIVALLFVLLAACGGETETGSPGTSGSDAATNDTTSPDTGAPDTSLPDTSAPDTSVPDTGIPDTSAPDTGVPDTSAPDTSLPDGQVMGDTDDTDDADASIESPSVTIASPKADAVLPSAKLNVAVSLENLPADGDLSLRVLAGGVAVGTAGLGAPVTSANVGVVLDPAVVGQGSITLTAVLRDGDTVLASSDPVTVSVSAAQTALNAIKEASDKPEEVEVKYDAGFPHLVATLVPVEGDEPYAIAEKFLTAHGALWGVTKGSYTPDRVTHFFDEKSGYEETVVAVRQRIAGVPVLNARLVLHLLEGRVAWVSAGRFLTPPPGLDVDAPIHESVTIGWARAQESAWEAFDGTPKRYVGEPRLVWYSPESAIPKLDRGKTIVPVSPVAHLVWQFQIAGQTAIGPDRAEFLVAATGDAPTVLRQHPLSLDETDTPLPSTARMSILDIKGAGIADDCDLQTDLDGLLAVTGDCTECGCSPTADSDSVALWSSIHTVWNYFHEHHHRQGYGNNRERVVAMVNASLPGNTTGTYYPYCKRLSFEAGSISDYLAGHEFTHGVVDKSVNLDRYNSSGALNEALAKVFGELIEGEALGNEDFDCQTQSWHCFPARDHVDHYCSGATTPACTDDRGDVHANAGLITIVAALLANGGTHPHTNIEIDKVGALGVRSIFYMVLNQDLDSNDGLSRMCDLLQFRARFLAPWEDIMGYDGACAVRNACAASGFTTPDIDCDNIPDGEDNDNDNDGWLDSEDNCVLEPNLYQTDTDKDGQGDACDIDDDNDNAVDGDDNCPITFNPGQEDQNGDGIGDHCEDHDEDNIVTADDNCPEVQNFNQHDNDQDGEGDACDDDDDNDGHDDVDDNCPTTHNVNQTDWDNDGVGNVCDNCATIENPDQADNEDDGEGDVCDDDDDNDLVLDADDNCPFTANELQYDGDDNGIGAACDEEERQSFLGSIIDGNAGIIASLGELEAGLRIPFDICAPGDCDSWVGLGTVYQVFVEADYAVLLHVVDQFGQVVSTGTIAAASGPGLFASQVSFSPSDMDFSLAGAQIPFVGNSYYLAVGIAGNTKETVALSFSALLLSAPPEPPQCGDGSATQGEACDGEDLSEQSCKTLGFTTGTLGCTWACQFDTASCTTCGNGELEFGEVCDTTPTKTCADFDWPGGQLGCSAGCGGFDQSTCTACTSQEQCNAFNGESCLADGRCGPCEQHADCQAPFLCTGGQCILN